METNLQPCSCCLGFISSLFPLWYQCLLFPWRTKSLSLYVSGIKPPIFLQLISCQKAEDDHEPIKDFVALSDIQEHLKSVQETFQTIEKKIFQKINVSDAYYSVQSRYKVPINLETRKPKDPKAMINIKEGFKSPFDVEEAASIKVSFIHILEIYQTLLTRNIYRKFLSLKSWQQILSSLMNCL